MTGLDTTLIVPIDISEAVELLVVAVVGGVIASVAVHLILAFSAKLMSFLTNFPVRNDLKERYTDPTPARREQLQSLSPLPDGELEFYVDKRDANVPDAKAGGHIVGPAGTLTLTIRESAFDDLTILKALVVHEIAHHQHGDLKSKSRFTAVGAFFIVTGYLFLMLSLGGGVSLRSVAAAFMFAVFAISIGWCLIQYRRHSPSQSYQDEYDADEAATRQLGTFMPVDKLLDVYDHNRDSEPEDVSWLRNQIGGETHPTPEKRQEKLHKRVGTNELRNENKEAPRQDHER